MPLVRQAESRSNDVFEATTMSAASGIVARDFNKGNRLFEGAAMSA